MIEPRWYCVLTAANREADACVSLRRQGYQTFWPRRWVTWSHRGKTSSALRPVLSRYIFAAVGEEQSVMAINETDGISRVLTMQGEAYVMPGEAMRILRQEFGADGVEPPGPETEAHIAAMFRGLDIGIAAILFAALGRIDDRWYYSPGTIIGRNRRARQRRSKPVDAEPAQVAA